MDSAKNLMRDFEGKLHEPGMTNDILTEVEKKTGLKRLHVVLGKPNLRKSIN